MKKLKLTQFSELAQIISAFALVVSLIYVGVLIKQNTKATQASMRQSIVMAGTSSVTISKSEGLG